MNKEFIPYEQALELKDLGFDEKCFAWYHKGWLTFSEMYNLPDINEHPRNVFAPLYQQCFRWFREKYKLEGVVEMSNDFNWYKFAVYYYTTDSKKYVDWGLEIDSYEEAELACLKKLIEIV